MMNKSRNATTWLALTATLALFVALGTGAALQSDGARHRELQSRAERVFAYDRSHANRIPPHLIRRLSVALEFHDDDGASQLLTSVESAL